MPTLKTKPTIFAIIAMVLLFAAAVGAATFYVVHTVQEARKPHTVVVATPQAQTVVSVAQTPQVETPIVPVALVKTAPAPLIVAKQAPAVVLHAVTVDIQDHCANIPGIQDSLPQGMAYDVNHMCQHIITQADVEAANALAKAESDAKAAQDAIDKQNQVQDINEQIAQLDLKYTTQDQSNTYLWHLYQNARNALLAQRDVITYGK